MAYDAFISYSHAADGRLAPALQSGLQRLAKPWYRVRALRVFRDETGLSTNPHLWSSIVAALDEAEWFVLLASPESARSEWVDKEIAHWLEHKAADRILPALTAGEWGWDSAAGRLIGDAVPQRLAAAIAEEPRHLDLRWAHDETDLDLRNSGFRSAIADLAAPMHGIAKDDLESEDIHQHRRARRLARAGVSAVVLLMILSLVFGAFAVNQRNQAQAQRNQANVERDRADASAAQARHALLVSQSQSELGTDRQLATLLAIEADRNSPDPDSRDALLSAVLAEPRLQNAFGRPADYLAPLAGHRVALIFGNDFEVWDWRSGLRVPWPTDSPLPAKVVSITAPGDGSTLALLGGDGAIRFYSGRTLEPLGRSPITRLSPDFVLIEFSENGQSLSVTGTEDPKTPGQVAFALYTRRGDAWTRDPASQGVRVTPRNSDFSSDGTVIASISLQPTGEGTGSDLSINDVATGRQLKTFVVSASYDIGLDWLRRRVLVSRVIGGAPGDASWYDLNEPAPTEHVIDEGLDPAGSADLRYDASHTKFGINGSVGFQVFDAATMAPLANTPVINTNTQQGPDFFLDANQVLLASVGAGPMSRWDIRGNSVLAAPAPVQFNRGIYPTGYQRESLGESTVGADTSVTVLDAANRPLGPPIAVDHDLARMPAAMQTVARRQVPVACVDPHTGRIATIAQATGDVVVHDGRAPFHELSRAPGVAARLAVAGICAWRPDGRQIAIGTYPQVEVGGATSIALYGVASRTLTANFPVPQLILALSLVYSPDSKVLWAGGPSGSVSNVYELTDLDGRGHIRNAFPGAAAIAADGPGRLLVLTGNTVRRYDAATSKPLGPSLEVRGETSYLLSVTPDGREVAISTLGGWHFVDLDALRIIGPALPDGFQQLAQVGGSGTSVYVQAADGEDVIWNLDPAHVRAVACGLAGRNLTTTEWQRYLPDAGPRRATCPQYPLN